MFKIFVPELLFHNLQASGRVTNGNGSGVRLLHDGIESSTSQRILD
jgi:hypothetical protein